MRSEEDCFGDDRWMLKTCADWRAARAEQQKNWAEHDLKTGWGYLDSTGSDVDLEPLDRMLELEKTIATAKPPRTVLLAGELLGVCLEILAQQKIDPESRLGQGPLLEIIRNVKGSLDILPGDMPIGGAVDS